MADTKEKIPATPEQKTRMRASKLIAFTTWRQEWRAANPEGTRQQRKEAWAKVRRAETRAARKAVKALEKGGFTLSRAETPAKA